MDDVDDNQKFREFLPVYSLAAAASGFGREEFVEILGWKRVNSPKKLGKDMFIAKVEGKSMEPTIPDGSYCVFRFEKGGSRNNLVVLVESRAVTDPEFNCQYTVKRYRSEKELFPDGTWSHKKIVLSPDNEKFIPIILENLQAEEFHVVAELIGVIN